MEQIILSGHECHIYGLGSGSRSVMIAGMFSFTGKEETSLIVNLQDLCKDRDYILVIYYVSDWNAEFSPWPAEDSAGSPVFAGGGPQTLLWLQDSLVPFIRENVGADASLYLAGYSLAGLFSLWAFYETGLFRGAACCSASLWMDGWDHYIQGKSAPDGSIVYLSLGGKEEKTKDAKMCLVGDRTRDMEKFLLTDPNVKRSILEWNKGGHFSDSGRRLAKGICWLLEN